MGVTGWFHAALTERYQHVTGRVLGTVTDKIGHHLWEPHEASDYPFDEGN
ncbi:hypothetical protein SAMN04487819_104197 [Actinopolyspora alba]|uniref:Uncharacterized protein n=1 Tax=Actinopolyspora alba TaxID=673379 RepID=A0A1I1VTR5_9ACTN|nr:hypothetical protein SAMN04487819_104197 [Actinopolyspora alba]